LTAHFGISLFRNTPGFPVQFFFRRNFGAERKGNSWAVLSISRRLPGFLFPLCQPFWSNLDSHTPDGCFERRPDGPCPNSRHFPRRYVLLGRQTPNRDPAPLRARPQPHKRCILATALSSRSGKKDKKDCPPQANNPSMDRAEKLSTIRPRWTSSSIRKSRVNPRGGVRAVVRAMAVVRSPRTQKSHRRERQMAPD